MLEGITGAVCIAFILVVIAVFRVAGAQRANDEQGDAGVHLPHVLIWRNQARTTNREAEARWAMGKAKRRARAYFSRFTSILPFNVLPSPAAFTSPVIRSSASTRSSLITTPPSAHSSEILSPSILPFVIWC